MRIGGNGLRPEYAQGLPGGYISFRRNADEPVAWASEKPDNFGTDIWLANPGRRDYEGA